MYLEHIELVAVRKHIGVQEVKIVRIVVLIHETFAAGNVRYIHDYIRVCLPEDLETFSQDRIRGCYGGDGKATLGTVMELFYGI